MYNLLIADDKDVFRRRITRMTYFKENQDKFSLCYLARNGLEALEFLNSGEVDIVLTDIKMPLMNGIELLKEINRNKLCKCTILLSEFSDFSYAREGIVNGAFDYIVKPVDDVKLKESFDRAYHFMQSQTDDRSSLVKSVDRLAASLAAEDALFLKHLDGTVSQIKKENRSLEEILLASEGALERINQQVLRRNPFISNYILLSKICTLSAYFVDRTGAVVDEWDSDKVDADLQDGNYDDTEKMVIQTEEELFQVFRQKISDLRHILMRFQCPTRCELVVEVWDYVVSDIEHAGSLRSVADKFYVNNKYLSTLFRKETGLRYTDFITYLKIERAKMLLAHSNLKVYAVSELLGFRDTEYFSKVFKKLTGVSPSAYCQRSSASGADGDQIIR